MQKIVNWQQNYLHTIFPLICFLIFSPAIAEQKKTNPSVLFDSPSHFSHSTIQELQLHLVWDIYNDWAMDLNWVKLRRFYQQRDFLPVWQSVEGPNDSAELVLDMLMLSDREGLDPAEYHTGAIQYMWRAKKARSRARLELLMTDAFFRYSVEVSVGNQFPRATDADWHVMPELVDGLEQLERFLAANDPARFIARMPPPHRAYARLKSSLVRYQMLAQQHGHWSTIPQGPQLQLGVDHEQVTMLASRLSLEGYLPRDINLASTQFGEELNRAVKQFQHNYGHKVDGIVGKSTRRSLNVSLHERIGGIKQNMERWRWVPRHLGERYIIVNMASYSLDYVVNGRSKLSMPVIIGEPYRATPAFVDTLKYVELNPTWSVPPRIAKEKFLPKIQKDPEFFARHKIKIFDSWRQDANEVASSSVDWNKLTGDTWFPYKLQQSPGKHNNMGLIKFMFPNRFRVYLHDTPNRKLFDRYVRTFSAGCIRISKPFELAKHVLKDNSSWAGDFKSILASGATVKLDLQEHIPVYILYWTAWVDQNGSVNFRRDVYQRDKVASSRG